MKRALFLLFAILAFPTISLAQRLPDGSAAEWSWESAVLRSTSAASVAQQRFWAASRNTAGFADSTVFRKASATITSRLDTTMAYSTSRFGLPPSIGAFTTQTDSTQAWLVVRVRQDTTSYAYASNSVMDSVHVSAEYSYNGINWFSCSGTPTYRFDVNFIASGEDGLQNTSLIGVENSPGEDAAHVVYKHVSALLGAQAFIVNKQLPFAGNYIRFIVGGDTLGQFTVDLGFWKRDY